ncbi:Crp/Fnr family transcriptional regulator [Halomonas sp. TRM85114]|uniref:Crp/Fnr family transcriptional regulator n=1 Tax=Halomonas jincaotanensis TaxID=2810616 RepID=UPI001BD4ADB9|nr:Crp/Fnr family transcriptional regulator [Halomonas jincaotanensis]MBS9404263.1 Crp/Fnr family transcriptional regulator [Halomonas jincaotanensis]
MSFTTSLSHTNRLLDSLPEEERERFLADCETVDLEHGQMLAKPGERISHAFFPIDCLVSLVASLKSGGQLEVSMAGNEEMVGISLMLGSERSSLQAVVQGAGPALRVSSACFLDHLEGSLALEELLRRHLYVLVSQLSQSAACAHFHQLEARLARALLTAHDRTRGDQLRLTHTFLSSMLGVRREGVSVAAKALQRRGLIDYYRGRITVHDRLGLEEASCCCYAADCEIYDQMLR